MKNIIFILLINLFLIQTVQAASMPKIPTATMQIARESGFNETITTLPRSQVVRVAIGNNNFSTYVYSETGIYATAEMQIYNGNNLVKTIPDNTVVIVKQSPNSENYDLFSEDNKKIASLTGIVRFTCPSGLLGVKDLKRASKPALYHGAFEIVRYNKDKFNLVNLIEVEEYLKGVVPNEMPVAFGLNALKAQTVAARNYVLSPRVKASSNYDVVDSVASQVYFGANTEKPLATQAVQETEGVVALYDWDLILAQYSSTAGGYTENFSLVFSDPLTKVFPSKEKPYLIAKADMLTQKPLNNEEDAAEFYKSKPDSYDIRSPYFRWEREWTAEELHDALETTLPAQSAAGFVKPAFNKGDKLDDLVEIKVKRRGDSGKIIEMDIITRSQTFTVQKELVIRRLFINKGKALPSANVVFECAQDDYGSITSIKAFGGGYGHGVGLSQFGAGFMGAELKMPYEKILKHYYTGITLGTKPITLSSHNSQPAPVNFYAPSNNAKIIIDNKFGINVLSAEINGQQQDFTLAKDILGHKRFVEIDISKYINCGHNTIKFSSDELVNGAKKELRLYVELVKKDDDEYYW